MTVKLELLKTACYFSKLDPNALENLSLLAVEKRYSSGDVILWQGDQDEMLYFVISGLVKLFASSAEGRELIVRLVYGGDSFNDDAIFDKGPNALSAMAMSPIILYGLSWQDLSQVLGNYPQVHSRIAEVFAARQRYLLRLATELVFKNVTGRLARLLLEREKLVRAGGAELKITQQEMAFMIGTVREIVSRSLRELEAMGTISLRHNQIIITDRNKLSELGEL
jgi:CRP/FNR family cyclic AMP-dependent transcriptional regulator